ncbi:MAG: hypothetical protein AAF735_04030 [Myxococcota bacterium]
MDSQAAIELAGMLSASNNHLFKRIATGTPPAITMLGLILLTS